MMPTGKASGNAVLAKARALYGSRLRADDYRRLMACRTMTELAAALKEYPLYSEALAEVNPQYARRVQLENLQALRVVEGILGADLAAADAAVVVVGVGVNAGAGGRAAVVGLMHGGRVAGVDRHLRVLVLRVGSGAVVLRQGTAAVAALRRARLVVGAAVRAGGLLRGFFGLGTELGLPFKPGGVLRLVHTGPDLLPAGPVVGRAAVGADDDVILVGKCLFTDRAMVSCVTCHVWYPFRNIRPLYRIKWINAKKT